MVFWPDRFCEELVGRGFSVIRFDNRDVGLSSRIKGQPALPGLFLDHLLGRPATSPLPYTVETMAQDALGLLDALGLERAHVVGASLGGMIAQHMALLAPDRVASLCSIMSGPGGRWMVNPMSLLHLFRPRGNTREEVIAETVALYTRIGGKYPPSQMVLLQVVTRAYERGMDPEGLLRQFAAALVDVDRRPRLRGLRVPTLVIHGKDDPLMLPSAGEATAEAIPAARLLMLEGMGHSLPVELWPQIIDGITHNTTRASPRLESAALTG